jgi:hypothetical protein
MQACTEDDHVKIELATIYEPKREALEETNPADTLILDLQPPEL